MFNREILCLTVKLETLIFQSGGLVLECSVMDDGGKTGELGLASTENW